MSVSVRTLVVVRATLLKAVQLIDAELSLQEGGKITCLHDDRQELTTMGKGPRKFLCLDSSCGARFSDEVEDEEQANTFRGLGSGRGRAFETTTKH